MTKNKNKITIRNTEKYQNYGKRLINKLNTFVKREEIIKKTFFKYTFQKLRDFRFLVSYESESDVK